MAIVHKYTIIYFTMIIQESISLTINRDMCLETVARFKNYEDKCDIALNAAVDILQDVTTCPKKCNFWIKFWNCNYRNYLKQIDLTIGNATTEFYPCSGSYGSYLYVNCSSWNAGEYITWDNAHSCFLNDAQCVHIDSYCICHCLPGYIFEGKKCLKIMVNIDGRCEFNWQCRGTERTSVCYHGLCSCSPGYIQLDKKCYQGNLELNDSCELAEQCIHPFSVCFQGKCKCINGYSAFDKDSCLKDTVSVGGFCSLHEQCTGSNNSGVCENGRCTCTKGFTFINLTCEKNQPNSPGSSSSQQHDTSIEVTLGTLFGGFILGVIVTAFVTTLMYKRLKFHIAKREEPSVMFADNRAYGGEGFDDSGAQISNRNNKKRDVAKLSPYSFSKETDGYNLSKKEKDERTEDVYNHLHEQKEQDDDTYDHACAVPNHSTDLSDYSNIRDTASVQPSPSKDGDDYSTLRH